MARDGYAGVFQPLTLLDLHSSTSKKTLGSAQADNQSDPETKQLSVGPNQLSTRLASWLLQKHFRFNCRIQPPRDKKAYPKNETVTGIKTEAEEVARQICQPDRPPETCRLRMGVDVLLEFGADLETDSREDVVEMMGLAERDRDQDQD
ncbi:Uu.00g134570.m01.CDS01 [Anthostomella pinea]|uniref:Uu.00g134570.m01.CDS01 n=1 Tax=Anthostomella pinea TaxID=933095 RepID=A0AAI8YKT4_9PEZI|nr:Uu.00g134570.m01.CDS01 [Anthostomella pinea]